MAAVDPAASEAAGSLAAAGGNGPARGEDVAAAEAAALLPDARRDGDGPVFRAPWEAEAFAMAVALHGRGAFTWAEWAAALAAEIARAQAAGDPDTGDTYYSHWLGALERLADAATLLRTREAWDRAVDRTPHGTPIELTPAEIR